MKKIAGKILFLLFCFVSNAYATASDSCWFPVHNSDAALEFQCSKNQYEFMWDGSVVIADGKRVIDGEGILTLKDKDTHKQTRVRCFFSEGFLNTDITIGHFYRCLDNDCYEIDYRLNESQVFRGEVSTDFENEKHEHIKTIDYGVLLDKQNNFYYYGQFEKNNPEGWGYACLSGEDDKDIELMYEEDECTLPSTYMEGFWKEASLAVGNVRMVTSDGGSYEGEVTKFEDMGSLLQPDGVGMYFWADNSFYQGQFSAGQREGTGTYQYPDGSVYKGEWNNNVKHGAGVLFVAEHNIVYQGDFSEGLIHGEGVVEFEGGITYIGRFNKNKPDGEGLISLFVKVVVTLKVFI